ncbi:PP2C family protein-serine/threonine phosphatase [Paludibaculum fermentans]|uniref:SpoIIE family protein phosphatase n=1 Tax=Paludibaculum fermentans TaxID=1473598 RepID=A0A7S7NVE4_PALFE|nr:SpoIIE family protein phosphatase [Paludibaculum fermentans]QOY90433.1 SpoIIE family protein phosphatase [Paludibaculum fermentans]
MPISDALLKPFVEPGSSAARRRWTLFFVLAAPLALAGGFWIQKAVRRGSDLKITIDRQKALEVTRTIARDSGIDVRGWREYVNFNKRPYAETYFERLKTPDSSRTRMFVPVATVSTLLMRPDEKGWVQAEMGPSGFVTAFRLGGAVFPAGAGDTSDAEAKAVAEQALRDWLGDMALARFGEPEASTAESAGAGSARRFIWRIQPRRTPEIELAFTFDVVGKRISLREVRPNFADSFIDREITPGAATEQLGGTLRVVLLVFLTLYAGYRYTRRTMEKEAPHLRMLMLASTMLAFGLVILVVDPFFSVPDLRPDQLRGPAYFIQLFAIGLVFALQGLLLGIAYGSGEGEVRESWPGKLTSLDTLLCGKLFSANVGASVLSGAIAAAWLFLILETGYALFGMRAPRTPFGPIAFTFGRMPLLILLVNLPFVALFNSVANLLVPLTFLRRHVKSRRLQYVLLGATALALGNLGDSVVMTSPIYWFGTAVLAVAVLVPFFAMDYLASVASLTAYMFLISIVELARILPYWRGGLLLTGAVAAGTLLPFAIAAWRGRRYEEEEVQPKHARNLAERLSLRAELNAAREAQLRLLPEHPPQIPGLTIAASCTPAHEVGGDFYDFFPISGGRLGVVVAEGGNDGLASALTIALAKGFLMYESSAGATVEETLARLEQALGSYLERPSGRTCLALFMLNPADGTVKMARVGPYPRMLILSQDGAVAELAPKPHQAGQAVESAHLEVMPGDALFIYTDGLSRLLEARHAGSPQELLRKAASFRHIETAGQLHDAVLEAVMQGSEHPREELTDDLTAVVLRYDSVAEGEMEEVA